MREIACQVSDGATTVKEVIDGCYEGENTSVCDDICTNPAMFMLNSWIARRRRTPCNENQGNVMLLSNKGFTQETSSSHTGLYCAGASLILAAAVATCVLGKKENKANEDAFLTASSPSAAY